MNKRLVFDGEQKHFSKDDLPILIHASEGSGGSLFSVSLVADLYNQGEKLLFLCGYHMARDEFKVQTNSTNDSILVSDQSQIKDARDQRVIFVDKKTPDLFIELVRSLSDIDKRILFFKNFDLFDVSIFETIENLQNLVLMGDVDATSFKDKLINKKWSTQVYFSEPYSYQLNIDLPELPKYQGYLSSKDATGLVALAEQQMVIEQ